MNCCVKWCRKKAKVEVSGVLFGVGVKAPMCEEHAKQAKKGQPARKENRK